jgi:NAD(P)-dependent dehydrogenase (short-subunit alcohol dehydrogenase family)
MTTSPSNPADGLPAAARPALVTGAGRGIGRCIAVRLAAAGHSVALTARSADQLEKTAELIGRSGGRAEVLPADATDAAAVAEVVRAASERLGSISILINNAGYAGPLRPFWETELAQWRQTVETNILGPVHFLHAVLPGMMQRGAGHVVNINSLQASDPAGSPLPYGVSKAALARLTDGLARQLADTGVVVFDLSPGLVRTAMTADRPDLAELPDSVWASPENAADQALELVSGLYDMLSGRFVRATDDLAALCTRVVRNPEARLLRLTDKGVAEKDEAV